jgi:seryl-tRNA synthetase
VLDIRLIRERPDEVRRALLKRMDHVDFTDLAAFDSERRSLISAIDALREKRNATSSLIGAMKQKHEATAALEMEMKDLTGRIKQQEKELGEIESK